MTNHLMVIGLYFGCWGYQNAFIREESPVGKFFLGYCSRLILVNYLSSFGISLGDGVP